MRKYTLPLFLALVLLGGCKARPEPATAVQPASASIDRPTEYLVQATLWQQHASEYRALCYQTYSLAQAKAAYTMQVSRFAKPPCVVLDIDETVLDNSPYTAWQIKSGQGYNKASWQEWTALAAADTVPGALGFLRWAESAGLEAFYVSNRRIEERAATIQNLARFGFPNADTNHVLLRTDVGNKEPRRQRIQQTHTIMMLVGDNLNDISEVFEGKTNAERSAEVERNRSAWGSNWIVLPNAMYGAWEAAMQGYQPGLTPAALDSIRHANLRSFR